MTTHRANHADWARGPLYAFMLETFPDYRTANYDVFDVNRFKDEPEIGKSHEAIYKWFRLGRLTIANAKAIIAVAVRVTPEGETPPTIQDLLRFL